jgi:hypothetical protein
MKLRLSHRMLFGLPRLVASNRIVRVAALALAMLSCLLAFSLHQARARTGEALALLGERVMQIPDGRYSNRARLLDLNGFPIGFQTGFSKRPYETIVAEFADACRSRAGMSGGDFSQESIDRARKSARQQLNDRGILDGVFELDTARGHIVACIDTRGAKWFSHGMIERLSAFSESGNLGAVGGIRYALVKRTPYGAHFVTMWTGEHAPLFGMFPKDGDAPGSDHSFVPRPKAGRRVLSMNTEGIQMVAFENSDARLDELAAQYETALRSANVPFQKLPDSQHQRYFRVRKGEVETMLTLAEREHRVVTNIVDFPP